VPSIEMVIYTAVGGRMSMLGAVYGTLLVNFGKTYFSESYPALWLLLMGGLFISVVMFFPYGLAGLYDKYLKHRLGGWGRGFAARRRAYMAARPGPAGGLNGKHASGAAGIAGAAAAAGVAGSAGSPSTGAKLPMETSP
jgi:hypothetical protein